jgi:hydroxymethylpyrimidine pyrophosphatase-like HAD family hydrolase
MENGRDEVKAVADFICASNQDNGIALWLEEHVL